MAQPTEAGERFTRRLSGLPVSSGLAPGPDDEFDAERIGGSEGARRGGAVGRGRGFVWVQPRRVADRVPVARGRRLLLGVRGGLEADRDAQVAATGRERNPPEGGVG